MYDLFLYSIWKENITDLQIREAWAYNRALSPTCMSTGRLTDIWDYIFKPLYPSQCCYKVEWVNSLKVFIKICVSYLELIIWTLPSLFRSLSHTYFCLAIISTAVPLHYLKKKKPLFFLLDCWFLTSKLYAYFICVESN